MIYDHIKMIWSAIKKALVLDLIILAVAGVILLLSENHTISRLGTILIYLGGATIAIGSCFILGSKIGSVDYTYHQSRSASQSGYHERVHQETDYIERGYYHSTLFFIAGFIAIGAEILVHLVIGLLPRY